MFAPLALALLACLGTPQDVSGALARLSSGLASERLEAERWLAVNLRPEHLALAAETARSGGAEERTRLARALGSDERHFALALLFAADSDSDVARIGEEAFGALAARWFGDELEPWSTERVVREIAGRSRGIVSLAPASDTGDESIERLARHAPTFHTDRARDVELGLAVEPALYADILAGKVPSRAEAGVVREGPFELVLAQLLVDLRVGFEGHGMTAEHPVLRIGWAADLGQRTTAQVVLDWCRDLDRYPDRPRGVGAARALAGCGWPAALAWLERRWLDLGDRNAFEGLLLAAGRGRVVSSLARRESVVKLLEELRAQRERDGRFDAASRRRLRALERLPRFAADGADLAQCIEASALGGRDGEALRFSALAAMGHASPELVARLRASLAQPLEDESESAALERLAALRLVARVARGDESSVELRVTSTLLDVAERARAGHELLAWAQTARARLQASAVELARGAADARLALLIEWLALDEGTRPLAAGLVGEWLRSTRAEVALGTALRARASLGDGAIVEALLADSRARLDARAAARLRTLALLAGVASPSARREWVEAFDGGSMSEADARWPIVGELAGSAEGESLREWIAGWAKGAAMGERRGDAPWVRAYERALQGLLARGEDRTYAELRRTLAAALRRAPVRHPLAEGLQFGTWPALPGPRPRALEALELGP
jgi:hypothetical protein